MSSCSGDNTTVLTSSESALYETGTLCTALEPNLAFVQGEEHVLLDCPSADSTSRTWQKHIKHQQHLFRTLYSGSSRLKAQGFLSRLNTGGLALCVHECLDCCT